MPTPAVLEFEGVTKEYRSFFHRERFKALDGFSLRVEPGEIFGFLGPNGAGKTTAIHIAMGLTFPSQGRGQMLGHPFGHAPTRRQVGFLAENVALYHRPAAKLLHFYGTLNGMRDPQLRSRTAEMLKEMDLQGAGQRSAGKFSRGMLQRLGLAEALMNDPQLLILDEPTSALDPIGRVHVREILLRARAAGKTIFLSSHQLSEVEHICDRVAIVVRGRLVRMGPLTQLLESQDQFMIIARGIDALMFGGTRQDGAIRVLVPALKQRETLEKIWVAGGEVIAVNPARRSLEELFVELAHQNGGADKPEGVQND